MNFETFAIKKNLLSDKAFLRAKAEFTDGK